MNSDDVAEDGEEPLIVEVWVARTTVLVIVVVDVEVVVPDDSAAAAEARGASKNSSPAGMCEQRMVLCCVWGRW